MENLCEVHLNSHRNFLNLISEIRLIFSKSPYNSSSAWKVILKSLLFILKLLSVEKFDNISKLQSNTAMKWPAGN